MSKRTTLKKNYYKKQKTTKPPPPQDSLFYQWLENAIGRKKEEFTFHEVLCGVLHETSTLPATSSNTRSLLTVLKRVFQKAMNKYRQLFHSPSKSRPLELGEYHLLGANYMGPGTRIDIHGQFPPLNSPDRIARQHDIDYEDIFHIKDKKKRALAIRKADRKMLMDLNRITSSSTNEPYKTVAKLGIKSKILFEDLLPDIALALEENYFGIDSS